MKLKNESLLKEALGYPMTYQDIYDVFEDNYKTDINMELLKRNYDDLDDFLMDVNMHVCKIFDANFGISWTEIETSIEHVLDMNRNYEAKKLDT